MKFFFVSFLLINIAAAQPAFHYTVSNAHSHNDYENQFPFQQAYDAGFGSIEADIFLVNGKLFTAHSIDQISKDKFLETLYIAPLDSLIKKNNGYPYADKSKPLQMLIDLKATPEASLAALTKMIEKYPALLNAKNITWTITGNQPDEKNWGQYPAYINFDGDLNKNYTTGQLARIKMFSAGLRSFTKWNGKSNIGESEKNKLLEQVSKIHALNKKIRFWACPDIVNAWYQLMNIGVDYINTDKIFELQNFLNKLPENSFTNSSFYEPYNPSYRNDGKNAKVKNVILMIGDGCGLAHLYAGFTANKGRSNIFNMRYSGFLKTNSHDSYITDSAPGSNAFSTGKKTNNRFVGVDHTGKNLKQLPDYLYSKKIETGLITTGDITDATPANFYGHNISRDNAAGMFRDLASSPVKLLMGSGNNAYNDSLKQLLTKVQFNITNSIESVNNDQKKWIVMEDKAGFSKLKGRENWLQQSLEKSLGILSKSNNGFFLMAEAAQIDYGGHANNLPYVATEVMDFDKAVGDAMKFADKNGETLVVVLADHETGGLSLLDGNINTGYVSGHFSTNDHTASPVPVFAYGPQSFLFSGFYENTEIFNKVLQAFSLKN